MHKNWQLAWSTALPPEQIGRRQFFFREQLPDGSRNIRPVYAPVQKLGVILDADAPWERKGDQVASFASTLIRLDDGRLRLYYTYVDGTDHDMRIAVAESDDGHKWQRIQLGPATVVGGLQTNRIIFQGLPGAQNRVCQPQVIRTPAGQWRMYFWKHGDGHIRYCVAESQDGLQWTVPDVDQPVLFHPADKRIDKWIKHDRATGLTMADLGGPAEGDEKYRARVKALMTNDATYVYYNEGLERYECYTVWLVPAIPDRREEVDTVKEVLRLIQRRLSPDGLRWSAPELIIRPDSRDPWDQQFYHLAVQWHEDWLIGSLGHYRVEDGQQTQDLELAFSRDGLSWERPIRGGFIPRDPAGRDSQGIYPPNAWVDMGDRWLCLYTGTARRHNEAGKAFAQLPGSCIMGAAFAKHRLVGLAAGRASGGFLSEPFFPQSDRITVDADVRGWLRAELCDVWGRKQEGYRLMESNPVQGDAPAHALMWKNKEAGEFVQTCVRLRFEYADAEVYSIGF